MILEKSFSTDLPPDDAARIAARDDTLLRLFDASSTEIIGRSDNRRTTRTHYSAFGREGVVVFHFRFEPDGHGPIEFEKVCDGNVWRELRGRVTFTRRGDRTRVTIEMKGRTKTLVPELAIRGPMKDQLDQMTAALKKCLDAGVDS